MDQFAEPGITNKQIDKVVNKAAVLFGVKVRQGQVLSGNISFAEFSVRWMIEYAEKKLALKTVSRDCFQNLHGDEHAFNQRVFEQQRTKILGQRTIKHHHNLISSMLSTAVEWQVIHDNPAKRVKAPKAPRLEAS